MVELECGSPATLYNGAPRKLGASATMRSVIFPVAYVERFRSGNITQNRREVCKYQYVGRVLLLRILSIH